MVPKRCRCRCCTVETATRSPCCWMWLHGDCSYGGCDCGCGGCWCGDGDGTYHRLVSDATDASNGICARILFVVVVVDCCMDGMMQTKHKRENMENV